MEGCVAGTCEIVNSVDSKAYTGLNRSELHGFVVRVEVEV